MKDPQFYKERAIKFANYILENETTLIETAKHFDVSDGTVAQSIRNWLYEADKDLYVKVKEKLKNNIGKGFKSVRGLPRTLIECECTNCKHNNATSKTAKGYCTLSKIKLTYKEFDLINGDETDVADCEMYHFKYKGKDFMKG